MHKDNITVSKKCLQCGENMLLSTRRLEKLIRFMGLSFYGATRINLDSPFLFSHTKLSCTLHNIAK
jgi:hypothetical protein